MLKERKKPNWLLRALMIVSLAIHLVIFARIARIYESDSLTYIELSLKDFSKPPARSIPRPPHRPKEPPELRKIQRPLVKVNEVPRIEPINVAPVTDDISPSIAASVSVPDLPAVPGARISQWQGQAPHGTGDFLSRDDYFSMLRMRIEQNKKYPSIARSRQIEGRVTVGFVVEKDGAVKSLRIIKGAPMNILNQAALDAVRDSAPFPVPPGNLFREPISLEITILFELT